MTYKCNTYKCNTYNCCNDKTFIKEPVYNIAYIMKINLYDIEFDSERLDGCMRKTFSNTYFNSQKLENVRK